MWEYSSTEDNWEKKVEKLDKRIYNYLRQEIEDVRFYSKCLDGTSYVASQDLNDIYDVLKYKSNITYKVDNTYSDKFNGISIDGLSISPSGFSETGLHYRYNQEYGFTLKNLFSPNRLINDSTNYLTVDVATTETFNFNNIDINTSMKIDGVLLLEGHRVLIKDNTTNVTLNSSVDPSTYFSSNYYTLSSVGSSITYYYYSTENGVYLYTGGTLVREPDLDNYITNIRYSVDTKMGTVNTEKQFHLSRLLSGYYPLVSNTEPIEFIEKENFIVRNSIEYRNVLDNQFYSGTIQQETSVVNTEAFKIPHRFISVGDFGFILNDQNDYLNIIKSKYKEDLRDIIELYDKYLIIGKNGTLISLDKVTLVPELLELNTFQNFKSIDFIDDNRGLIVGENGTIILTQDQYDWNILETNIESNLNKVKFIDLTNAVTVGDNGLVNKLLITNNSLDIDNIELSIKDNLYDEKPIIKDLVDIDKLLINNERFKFIGNDWIDITKNIGNSNFSFDFRFKSTNLIGSQTIFSFLTEKFPTTTGSTLDKGIRIILEEDASSNHRIKMYVNDDIDPTTFIILDGDINVEQDKWYHIFVTRDKSDYNLVVDQKLADTTSIGFEGSFDNFSGRIRLGAELTYTDSGSTQSHSTTSFNQLVGSIDHIRLWNKKLDDTEIEVYSNNYQTNLSGLSSWYKLNVYKPDTTNQIRTKDLINETSLILPITSNLTTYNNSGGIETTMIDVEDFTGFVVSGENLISLIIDIPTGYSNQSLNNKLFIESSIDNINNIVFNTDNYLYCSADKLFRLDIEKFEFDLFNQINVIDVTEEILLDSSYKNIKIDGSAQLLYLIGGSNNQTETVDITSICSISELNPIENCGVYSTVSFIGTTNSITIENDYRNDVYLSEFTNCVEYIKTTGYPGTTQSVLEIPITSGTYSISPYTELYLSLEVNDLINGSIEISLDNMNFTELEHNGEYLIPLTVGSDSKIHIRAILSSNPNGDKIKGLIKNMLLYEASCVQILAPKTYTGGTNIKKLYFTQFDTSTQLNKLNGSELYSYIDLKSLKINDVEQISTATFSVEGFPAYLYPNSFSINALVNCDIGGLCDYIPSLTNNVIDRVQYGFGLQVSGSEYTYVGNSYGLLEALTINTNQIFGLDRSGISNGTTTIDDPIFTGIDFTKSFRMEVDSMILDSTDLLNSDISNGYGSQSVTVDATTFSYGTPSGTFFNQLSFTASTSLTYSIITDEQLNQNQTYYIEMELDGSIQIDFASQSFTYSATGSIINDTVRLDYDQNNFIVFMSSGVYADINNLVISDRLPTKSIIEWDPTNCQMSYKLNGVDQTETGFLQENGNGQFAPTCTLNSACDNTSLLNTILDENYWDAYKSKLLFLDYDIGSKLYFFDTQTEEYQLPQTVDITSVDILEVNSITSEKSWLDYSKDSTKEFQYYSIKNDANIVEYSSIFTLTSATYSYDIILNGNSSNDLTDINGATSTYGLLPPLIGTMSTFGTPSSTHSYYFYDKYMIIRQPTGFEASLGDIIRLNNNLIDANMMVIYTFNDGTDDYLYLNSNFNQSITNRLVGWTKNTTITNLNLYNTELNLISNFNLHPVSVGYVLSDNDDGTITVDPQFNTKTAYYNLQCSIKTTDTLLNVTTQNMNYINKVSSFGYSATYNILDYMSKNSVFDSSYIIGSLPSYSFSNSNAGVIYTVSSGQISFNSDLKGEWESIPLYTFIDMTFGSTVLGSVLVIGKSYDSSGDRYIIQTYNYYGHIYDQLDISDPTWELRVRNTLGEISSDLQKINNIQRSSSLSYHITDLSNNIFTTYTTDKSELNFKPNTDSYCKSLLSQKEVKEYLTGIIYTDYKNELALNMVNLSEERNLVITGIEKYDVDCDDCVYEEYVGFVNPGNSNEYNQISVLSTTQSSDTYYTDRIPYETYGYNNQINVVGATGGTSTFSIDFVTQSGSSKVLEFKIESLTNGYIEIIKDSSVISTISTQPNNPKVKVEFVDNGVNDLFIQIVYTTGHTIEINDIRIGNDECVSNCYLAQLKIPNHGLSIGDGIIIDINEDIYNLNNLYTSDFDTATNSMWIENIGGTESFIPITNGAIGLTISSTASIYYPSGLTGIGATQGQTYRLTFDYKLDFISGTPSLRPAFGTMSIVSDLPVEFDLLSINGQMTHVESNFIPTGDSIFVGFNIDGEAYLTLNNISIDLLSDRGQVYDGYQVVKTIIDIDTIVIDIDHTGNIEELNATYSYINNCGENKIGIKAISNIGEATQFIFDPYLNYAPIDLFELGNDDELKKAIEIKPYKWVENSDETISLVDLDMTNFRFRLIDGLSLADLNDVYPWILESEIRDALIGKDINGIVWYSGIWDCGRWFGGTWYSGVWRSGQWYSGTWNNSEIEDNQISAEVSVLNSKKIQSTWYSGDFRGGTWNNGVWRSGNHYDGTWENGEWNGGTWHLGTWNKGLFKRGTWIDGIWENGIFNCDLGASNWLDGTWNGGDFECGRWFSGRFDSKNSLSRFGTNPDLSRQAIWENGNFINGEFYSGVTGSNSRHDLSIWNTGFWNNGTWNGGTAHQINWNNGVWNNGVVKEINVIAFIGQSNGTYFFTLEGDWQFKIGDFFWIIDNNIYSSIYGSDSNQVKYKVDRDFITINNGQYTKVLVSKIPTSLSTAIINNGGEYVEGYTDNNNPSDDTLLGTRLTTIVSHFSQVEWYNGQWQNGIFDGTFFRDGIWEKGVFKSGDFGY